MCSVADALAMLDRAFTQKSSSRWSSGAGTRTLARKLWRRTLDGAQTTDEKCHFEAVLKLHSMPERRQRNAAPSAGKCRLNPPQSRSPGNRAAGWRPDRLPCSLRQCRQPDPNCVREFTLAGQTCFGFLRHCLRGAKVNRTTSRPPQRNQWENNRRETERPPPPPGPPLSTRGSSGRAALDKYATCVEAWNMSTKYGQRASEVVVALSQRPGAKLSEIAEALAAPLTSVQRAVQTLVADDLVAADADRAPGYLTNADHPAADALTAFSLRVLPAQRAMDIVARTNPATYFAGRDDEGYIVVFSPFAEPADAAKLEATLERINRSRRDGVPYELIEREDLKRRLLDDLALRERGLRMVEVKGSAVRAFRDPLQHGSFDAQKLRRLHPSLPAVSRRLLRDLATKHGLSRVIAFGSSVRSDFRPDSDVDMMFEPRSDVRVGLASLLDIQERLENAFDRDVDLVNARALTEKTLRRAQEEGVVLYE